MTDERNAILWRKDQYRTDEKLKLRIALHREFATNPQLWTAWVREQLPLHSDSRILDLGCGSGELWETVAASVPEKVELLLADRSMGMLRSARGSLANSAISYLCCDAGQAALPANAFDLVLANHLLFHLPDIPAALQEIHRLLKPGGTLCATTYGWNNMQELFSLVSSVKTAAFGEAELDPQSGPRRFALENGQVILTQIFGNAVIRIYHGHLHVTAIEQLIAYIQTIWQLTREEETTLRMKIDREIQTNGYFFIGKSQGMLIAEKTA